MIVRFEKGIIMKKLLSRGGIEIIAVFIGITGGLWSEKQIEHNKTLDSEKIALKAIREKLVSDSTEFHGIIKSYESEQQNMKDLFKHIDSDTILSEAKLNSIVWDLLYFQYFSPDKSIYESLIKGAGKKIIQSDSIAMYISYIYETNYKHLDNVFMMQKDILSLKTFDIFIESGGYLDSRRYSITNNLNRDQAKMFTNVLSNDKFVTQLVFHYDTSFFLVKQYEWSLKVVKKCIKKIDENLLIS